MEGLMGQSQQEQQLQEPIEQGATQGQQGQGGTYPQSQEEVKAFIADLMKALYSEKSMSQLMPMLSKAADGGQLPQVLGQVAGAIVMSVVGRRRKQTGRKPHIKMVVHGLRMVMRNLADMLKTSGVAEVDNKVLQQASVVAGKIVEDSTGGAGQPQRQSPGDDQQQAPQPPPQQGRGGY